MAFLALTSSLPACLAPATAASTSSGAAPAAFMFALTRSSLAFFRCHTIGFHLLWRALRFFLPTPAASPPSATAAAGGWGFGGFGFFFCLLLL